MHGLRFVGSGVICATQNRVVGWSERGDLVANAVWISLDTVTVGQAVSPWGRAALSFHREYSTVTLEMPSASARTFAEAVARNRVAKVMIERPAHNWIARVSLLSASFVLGVLALLYGFGVIGEKMSSVWLATGGLAIAVAVISRNRLLRRTTSELRLD